MTTRAIIPGPTPANASQATGTLPVTHGGTGATDAAGARTALSVPAIGHTHVPADVTGLAAVATLGTYTSLTGLPSIPQPAVTTPLPLGVAAVGVAATFALADHVHLKPSLADLGAAAAVHTHAIADVAGLQTALNTIPALASTTPAAVGTAAVGVGTTAARDDHVHAFPNVGTPGTYGDATHIPVLTTDAQGRVTGVVSTLATAPDLGTQAVLAASAPGPYSTTNPQTLAFTDETGVSESYTLPTNAALSTAAIITAVNAIWTRFKAYDSGDGILRVRRIGGNAISYSIQYQGTSAAFGITPFAIAYGSGSLRPTLTAPNGQALYTTLAGLTLQLSVNGGATITVTFLAGDSGDAALCASRVNAATSAVNARNSGGFLALDGKASGADQSITIIGGTALTKFGWAVNATSSGTNGTYNREFFSTLIDQPAPESFDPTRLTPSSGAVVLATRASGNRDALVMVDIGAASATLALTSGLKESGRGLYIKAIILGTPNANTVTINCAAGDTFDDGATTKTISVNGCLHLAYVWTGTSGIWLRLGVL
jgi:hypothetical protein